MTPRKGTYNKEELLACGHGTLLEKDSPRLPVGRMLMIDRVTKINRDGGTHGRGELVAQLDINPNMWFFDCHFLGDPVMPGCLGLDALWQLTGFYLAWLGYLGQGRALGADNVRFSGEVSPQANLVEYHLHIQRIVNSSLVVAYAGATVSVDDTIIYSAKKIRAGVLIAQQKENSSMKNSQPKPSK